ncbi:hypothetical protein DWY25_11405 [Holdemania filiformis]|uniref:Uncharacterized protein n=1 Tax=Holdemania filiformis TaxID=61171 RepID=A0A412FWX9_9FIRM|nr:hypothetical protein DWY25_11405 [Holdemania filiformis]
MAFVIFEDRGLGEKLRKVSVFIMGKRFVSRRKTRFRIQIRTKIDRFQPEKITQKKWKAQSMK